MNIDLARHVARAAFRARTRRTCSFLKDQLGPDEYKVYAKAIGSAVAAIQVDLMNKLIADHPGA